MFSKTKYYILKISFKDKVRVYERYGTRVTRHELINIKTSDLYVAIKCDDSSPSRLQSEAKRSEDLWESSPFIDCPTTLPKC